MQNYTTSKNKAATLLQEEIIYQHKKAAVEHICKCTRLRLFLWFKINQ